MRTSKMFLPALVAGFLLNSPVLAEMQNPCKSSGELKNWAKKAGLTQDVCVNDAWKEITLTEEDVPKNVCNKKGNIKGWAVKAGFSQANCEAEPEEPIVEVPPPVEPEPEPVEPEPSVFDVAINWSTPTARDNGEALSMSDIAGYMVYCVSENTGEEVTVSVPGNETSLVMSDLSSGVYYFSLATVDTDGLFSEMSEIVTVNVN